MYFKLQNQPQICTNNIVGRFLSKQAQVDRQKQIHKIAKLYAVESGLSLISSIDIHQHISELAQHVNIYTPHSNLFLGDSVSASVGQQLQQTTSQASQEVQQQAQGGFLAPITNALEYLLINIQQQLQKYSIPYSSGYTIIILTAGVRLALFPVTKKQVESSMAMQELKPRIDNIKARYKDKERVQKETAMLYEDAQVNPLAGCLPALVSLPIFLGLYRSLTSFSSKGFLQGGFYFIPDLTGPNSLIGQSQGISWLYPFKDGHPPIGWENALAYLALPILAVITQLISNQVLSPVDPNAENAGQQYIIFVLLTAMIGWFALNLPAGMSLYYVSNILLSTLISIYLKKLGGADVNLPDLGPITQSGSGRKYGQFATNEDLEKLQEMEDYVKNFQIQEQQMIQTTQYSLLESPLQSTKLCKRPKQPNYEQ